MKRYGGQFVNAGEIIVRQKGTKFLPGANASKSSDDSIFARKAGIVTFEWAYKDKKKISVYPKDQVKKEPAKAAKKPAAKKEAK
jgi:large subunit ribosomal protein L27